MRIDDHINTPHQNCLSPIKVKQNGQTILAPCGKCAACRISRANVLVQLCNIETLMHPNMYFITLTYSENYVPRYEFTREVPSEAYVKGYNTMFRLNRWKSLPTDHDDDVSFYAATDSSELRNILDKQLSPNCTVMGLYRPDTQRFVKRLNKQLKKMINDETFKMRYFLCGEYGPLHLRPHYHLLLWFDTPVDISELADRVSSCWPYGRTDTQIARGGCCNYVSGYVNSYGVVPKLFADCRRFACFAAKSNRLGFDYLVSKKDEIYDAKEISPSEVDSNLLRFWTKIRPHASVVYNSDYYVPCYPINGQYVPLFFYRYVKNWFFPRTIRYNQSDRNIVKEDFMLYEYATRYYSGAESLAEVVRCIIDDMVTNFADIQKVRKGEDRNIYYPNREFFGFLANMSTYFPDSRPFLRGAGPLRHFANACENLILLRAMTVLFVSMIGADMTYYTLGCILSFLFRSILLLIYARVFCQTLTVI